MEDLIRESQRGDRNAFGDLVSRFRGDLDAFVQSRLSPALRERLDPEDVVQDTFLTAFEGLERFELRGTESFVRWLRAIAEHLIRNASRKRSVPLRSVSLDIAGHDTSPSRAMRRSERLERLQEAIQSLSPDHRQVIELARIRGLKTTEIGERMGRSPGAVRLLLFRALEQLRARFGDTDSLGLPDRELSTDPGGSDV